MNLYLLRHAKSEANLADEISSSLPGSPLSQEGLSSIKDLCATLDSWPPEFSAVYVSPFCRTLQTYIEMIKFTSLPAPRVDYAVQELNYGEFDGCKAADVNAELLEALRRVRLEDMNVRFGVNGESEGELLSRIYEWLLKIISTHGDEEVLCITHQSVISIIRTFVARYATDYIKSGTAENSVIYKVHLDTSLIKALKDELISVQSAIMQFPIETLLTTEHISISHFVPSIALPKSAAVTACVGLLEGPDGYIFTHNTRGYDIPGGHLEAKDPDYMACFLRETYEELGVRASNARLIGYMNVILLYKRTEQSRYPNTSIIPVYSAKATALETSNDRLVLSAEACQKSQLPDHIKSLVLYDQKIKEIT